MGRPCKTWCGTNEVPAREAYYSRKGLFYCRDRCVRAAVKAGPATPPETPGDPQEKGTTDGT